MTTPISDVPLANGDADGCTVPREPWLRLFLRFLRFGALAWGGPVAQIAMIRQELVDEDRWISSAHFNRVLAVYQVLPGPEAHELCVYFGMRSRGRWGGVLAGLGFMLPGFVLMFALSWAYVRYGLQTEGVAAVFAAVQVAVAALIVRAVVRIGEHVVTDRWLWGIAIGATAAQLAGIHFGIILTVAGGIYLLAQREFRRLAWALAALAVAGVIGYAVAMGGLAGFAALSGSTGDAEAVRRDGMPMLALFWSGLKAGLLTFGGAYTVIPFLQRDAVTQGVWMSNTQFLEGLALSGLLPAPLIIFSTFVGYLGGGPWGAVAMTVGIFLPAFAFTLVGHDALERVVHQPRIRLFLEGLTAGVVGLIAGTTLALMRISLTGLEAVILFALVLAVLFASKAKLVIPAVIGAAALWGWLSLSIRIAA
ncbi:chromate efflux transporter [Stenotrophomonas sp. PA-6-5C]|uniref:chromate efflux transporter n=1 Tax=Stenotrophomonas sp. PA-6-5C TaxID=2665487 RepID=UPI001F16EFE9|nr:chromate efflux transporter [Stenotrophomonas sp. PA-6-5C]MCF5093039.1 chromate efflux transporter [Stenotrophomonas sp. PA-6-5C]